MAKPKLNKKIQDHICEVLKDGNYIITACEASGISKNAFFMWMNKGEKATEGIYKDFYDSVKKAQADSETFLLKTIKVKSLEQWQAAAWMLERKFPERWGRREYVKVIDDTPSPESSKVQSLKEALNNMTDRDLENLLESLEE